MNNENKVITEYLTISSFPETKEAPMREEDKVYRFDVLKGKRIPSSPSASRSSIKDMELKFSPNLNTPGIRTSAIEVTKQIAENLDSLKKGDMYAKVTVYMSPRSNRQGVSDFYTPYINNVELVATDDTTRPYIQAALTSDETPVF